MKKLFALSLVTLALGLGQAAQATPPAGPVWGCQIDASLNGHEEGFLVAYKILEGKGTMKCAAVTGDEIKEFPIYMKIEGAGVGLGWSELRNQHFLTGSVGVTEPGYMYGKWQGQINADATVFDVNGTAGIGVEFNTNHNGVRGAAVKGVLSGGDANGGFAGITLVKVTISPIGQ